MQIRDMCSVYQNVCSVRHALRMSVLPLPKSRALQDKYVISLHKTVICNRLNFVAKVFCTNLVITIIVNVLFSGNMHLPSTATLAANQRNVMTNLSLDKDEAMWLESI
jgi:hypothetical protein